MITMEMIGKVRRMKLRDKLSNTAIAKLTGLSRNTVKKWLKAPGDVVPKYSRESPAGILSFRLCCCSIWNPSKRLKERNRSNCS